METSKVGTEILKIPKFEHKSLTCTLENVFQRNAHFSGRWSNGHPIEDMPPNLLSNLLAIQLNAA
uniref:Uncharacterized protein n=1 Tax=Octopus bimaculoides TaxID=37653 RepID=A0A0L8HMZ7_OCTBM